MSGCLVRLGEQVALIVGDSGSGKTDCLLELADRGHQVLADDAVEWRGGGQGMEWRCPEALQGLLAVRGLGLVRCPPVAGGPVTVDLAIELVRPDRTEWSGWPALEPVWTRVAIGPGLDLAALRLPVAPGRPLALLVEQAVRAHAAGPAP